jgi:tetratricopeptide (TPR) repeat protein
MQRLPLLLMIAFTLVAGKIARACAEQDGSPVRAIHAKSQQEVADYSANYSLNGGAAQEQAAIAFAQKYPESELRESLFARAMQAYQRENSPDGILKMGERVLALDPNHSLALVLTATVLADSLVSGDPDRDKKVAEIKKNTARAIQTIDTNFVAPAAATPEQAAIYKTTLQAMAYSALGVTNLKTGDYTDAEKNLKMAAGLGKIHPDPYIWYHLALAQDHRRKYPAALNSVEQALQLASANPDLQKLAETEHQRLTRLAGHGRESTDSGAQPPE